MISIEKWGGPPLLSNLNCTKPYYTQPVKHIEKWGGPPPLSYPKCTEPYYTKPLEPIEKYSHIQCKWTPHWAQVYIALLHHRVSLLLINPKCKEPYYTKAVISDWEMRRPSPPKQASIVQSHTTPNQYKHIEKWGGPPPLSWPQVYRAVLHQTIRTYWEMIRHIQCKWTPHWAQVYMSPTTPNQ